MLYFYCCEITNKLVTAKSSGTVEVCKRLEKMEEFEAIREFIEKELEKKLEKDSKGTPNTKYIFTAFNPL